MKTEKKLVSKMAPSKKVDSTESLADLYRRYFTPSQNSQLGAAFEQVSLFDYSLHISSSSSTPVDVTQNA